MADRIEALADEPWTSEDLQRAVAEATPEGDALVTRVLADRIAGSVGCVEDPGTLLHDLSCAIASIRDAAEAIIRSCCGDTLADPDVDAELREALYALAKGGHGIDGSGWI